MGQVTIRSTSQNTKVEWMPTLDVAGKRFLLNKAHTSVGRDAAADIQIDDNGLSRKHFEIVWDGKNAAVRDLRSTNGTTVNGKKIDEVAIADNTLIQAGRSDFTFRVIARTISE
jgi:pSer/pThr/pTyr-binding forkhead associated (FHA) protein